MFELEPDDIFKRLTDIETPVGLLLKVQFTSDVLSTTYFDPSQSWCSNIYLESNSYMLDDNSNIYFYDMDYDINCYSQQYVGNLLKVDKVTLIHRDNFIWRSGTSFGDGEIYHSVVHGNGTWFTNDYCHVGEFTFGQADNFGVRYYKSGDKYVGFFGNNDPIFNVIYRADCICYVEKPKYEQGKVFGALYWDDGDIEIGYHDKFDNLDGLEYHKNGGIFTGRRIDGNWNGLGQLCLADGDIYLGNFKDNQFDGIGNIVSWW